MYNLQAAVEAAPLGDARNNARALEIITSIVQGHVTRGEGVEGPVISPPWAHTMGCFRFYNVADFTLDQLYTVPRKVLADLVVEGERALIIHDFSTVDYSHHNAKKDRISVGDGRGKGYDLYSALVVDELGHPLGPLVQEVRTAAGRLSSESEDGTPLPFVGHIEQVEEGIQVARQHLPKRKLVHIMDAEFDDIALESWLTRAEGFVVRAQHLDRRVGHHGRATTLANATLGLAQPSPDEVTWKGKTYQVWRGETQVTFHGLSWRGHNRGQPTRSVSPFNIRVVVVELRRHGWVATRWVLLTNLTDSLRVVAQFYIWRWLVERLFFLIKVGIRLEDWQQQCGEAIARRLALSSLAAMAIYQLQSLRDDPGFRETLRFVALVGGWLGRKGDAIGPIVLMRGMAELISALSLLERLGPERIRALGQAIQRRLGLQLPFTGG